MNRADMTAKLVVANAPAEYCLPVKKDRRFSPVFQVKARLYRTLTVSISSMTTPIRCPPVSATHSNITTTLRQPRAHRPLRVYLAGPPCQHFLPFTVADALVAPDPGTRFKLAMLGTCSRDTGMLVTQACVPGATRSRCR